MMLQKTYLLSTAAALAVMVGSAEAAIITPTSATSNSTISSGSRVIQTTIDSSGLSGNGNSSDILSETHILSTGNTGNYWLSDNGGGSPGNTTTLTFALGGTFEVDGVHLWTYDRLSDNAGRALESFDVSFSTDGGSTYGSTINLAGWLFVNDPGYARVNGQIAVQSKTFAPISGVTHIKLDNLVNHGNAYVGFSEIRFNQVPEPGSLALLGLGGLLIAHRRRG